MNEKERIEFHAALNVIGNWISTRVNAAVAGKFLDKTVRKSVRNKKKKTKKR